MVFSPDVRANLPSVSASLPVANPPDQQFQNYMVGLSQGAGALQNLATGLKTLQELKSAEDLANGGESGGFLGKIKNTVSNIFGNKDTTTQQPQDTTTTPEQYGPSAPGPIKLPSFINNMSPEQQAALQKRDYAASNAMVPRYNAMDAFNTNYQEHLGRIGDVFARTAQNPIAQAGAGVAALGAGNAGLIAPALKTAGTAIGGALKSPALGYAAAGAAPFVVPPIMKLFGGASTTPQEQAQQEQPQQATQQEASTQPSATPTPQASQQTITPQTKAGQYTQKYQELQAKDPSQLTKEETKFMKAYRRGNVAAEYQKELTASVDLQKKIKDLNKIDTSEITTPKVLADTKNYLLANKQMGRAFTQLVGKKGIPAELESYIIQRYHGELLGKPSPDGMTTAQFIQAWLDKVNQEQSKNEAAKTGLFGLFGASHK